MQRKVRPRSSREDAGVSRGSRHRASPWRGHCSLMFHDSLFFFFMIHLNLDFSACPPNCCLPHFPTQIPHLMQFPFALVSFLPIPHSFATTSPAPASSPVFYGPAIHECLLPQCLGLLREPPGRAEPTTGWGQGSGALNKMPYDVFKRNHTVMDSALWDLSTQKPLHSSPLSPVSQG